MGMVFDRFPLGGGIRILALALADHAHDDGSRVFPSVSLLASKTLQSERTVQYQLRQLVDIGWLQVVRESAGGRGRTSEYRISPEWINGAKIAPFPARETVQPEAETVQLTTRNGATAVAPEPSIEPSITSLRPNSRSDGEGLTLKPDDPAVDPEAIEDEKLARWMFALVLGLYPKQRPPNWRKWAGVLRLMRERDGHSRREIAELFRWANRDAFWQSNILSPGKLREQWATLWIRRQSESEAARTGVRGQAPPPRVDHQCAWIEGGIRCRCAGVTSVGAHVDSPWYCAEHLERVERGERGDAPPPRAAMSAQARLH